MSDAVPMIRLVAGAATSVGQIRSVNEDSLLVTSDVVAVADGMGGHRAGEVASADTIEVLSQLVGHRSLIDLVGAVHLANRRISDRAAEDEALRGMGTTVCLVGLVDEDGEHLAVLNVGDSRVYLFASAELTRLTEDHSLVETLVREGRITPAEAEVHPQRNVLTRALGVEALVVVDAWLLSPRDDDRLLLCSDGLFNELSEDRIAEILGDADVPEVAARRLTAEADAAGGRDNITAVVVQVVDSGRPPEPLGSRYRRIATPTVDLDDAYRDPSSDTAIVPLVPISATPRSGNAEFEDEAGGPDEIGGVEDTDAEFDEGDSTDTAADADSADDPVAGSVAADAPGSTGTAEPSGSTGDEPAVDPDMLVGLASPAAAGESDADGSDATSDPVRHPGRSWRTPVFILAVLMLVVLSLGAVVFNARRGWFVGADEQVVVLYSGRPDTFLWIQPTPEEAFDLAVSDLSPKLQSDVETGREFDSEADARRFVANLEDSTTTTTTTTMTTTTTTVPPTTLPPVVDPLAPPATPPA